MQVKAKNILFCLVLICAHFNYSMDPVEKVFTDIYKTNGWLSQETISGIGSELKFTQTMSKKLSALIKILNINSIADAPCGDLNWMRYVDIGTCRYIGIDIVQELIERNKEVFGSTREFVHLNLIENIIEKVDLIICRDLCAHLMHEQIVTVLKNFKQSGSTYILMTTNTRTQANYDVAKVVNWRGINFELPPFNFPKPLLLIEEETPFAWEKGKHLGLWRLDELDIN